MQHLRKPSFHRWKTHPDDQAQMAHQQENGNGGADCKRRLNRNVDPSIGHQQVKREKCTGHKNVVHGVEFNAPNGCENKQNEEEGGNTGAK